jgi:hypothetical protein
MSNSKDVSSRLGTSPTLLGGLFHGVQAIPLEEFRAVNGKGHHSSPLRPFPTPAGNIYIRQRCYITNLLDTITSVAGISPSLEGRMGGREEEANSSRELTRIENQTSKLVSQETRNRG